MIGPDVPSREQDSLFHPFLPCFRLPGVQDPLQDTSLGRAWELLPVRQCRAVRGEEGLQVNRHGQVLHFIQGGPGPVPLGQFHHLQTGASHQPLLQELRDFRLVHPAPVALRIPLCEELVIAARIALVRRAIDPAEAERFVHRLRVMHARGAALLLVDDEPDRSSGPVIPFQPFPPFLPRLGVEGLYALMGFHDWFLAPRRVQAKVTGTMPVQRSRRARDFQTPPGSLEEDPARETDQAGARPFGLRRRACGGVKQVRTAELRDPKNAASCTCGGSCRMNRMRLRPNGTGIYAVAAFSVQLVLVKKIRS